MSKCLTLLSVCKTEQRKSKDDIMRSCHQLKGADVNITGTDKISIKPQLKPTSNVNLPRPSELEGNAPIVLRYYFVDCRGMREGESRIPFFNHIPLWHTKKFCNKSQLESFQ